MPTYSSESTVVVEVVAVVVVVVVMQHFSDHAHLPSYEFRPVIFCYEVHVAVVLADMIQRMYDGYDPTDV
jgi:hypothetical protein